MLFKDVPVGHKFKFNKTEYVKKSTITAELNNSNGRWVYFSENEVVYYLYVMDDKTYEI